MSPRRLQPSSPRRVDDTLIRLRVQFGRAVYEERRRRHWTLAAVGSRAGVSVATVQRIEAGRAASLEACVRVALALNLEPELISRGLGRGHITHDVDPVHAAMGEVLAAQFACRGRRVMLDEPYQHYQFAGRADVVAVDIGPRALLHVENRTRFPDLQGCAGSWNAKRSYLAPQIALRLGIAGGFASIDHVIVALWTSEVLHSVRLRRESFRALAPDGPDGFAAWWDGTAPLPGTRSSLIIFDPLPGQRRSRRRWVGLDQLDGLEPRYRGYADALEALRRAGRA